MGLVHQNDDILWEDFTVKEHLDFYFDLLDAKTS